MSHDIYLDNPATTMVDARVLEAMLPYFAHTYANPASQHRLGKQVEKTIQQCRSSIANHLGASAREIVFLSGATEANNLALQGAAHAYHHRGNHIITCQTEHNAVLDTCRYLEKTGFQVSYLPANHYGIVDLETVQNAISKQTILFSFMAANNEVGSLSPIEELGKLAKAKNILFHCDATQALGKIPLHVEKMGVDLLSFSAHKFYGPKGIGALYIRAHHPRLRLQPLIYGGGHENGLRSGTLNTAGIVGMSKALEICVAEMTSEQQRIWHLRKKLLDGLAQAAKPVVPNGDPQRCIPGILNLSFPQVDAEALMQRVTEIALSSGSACTSANKEPSHVLLAMGIARDLCNSSLRFGIGRFNTAEEICRVIDRIAQEVKQLRAMAPNRP